MTAFRSFVLWLWNGVSGPLGALALIIGLILKGPDIYTLVVDTVFDTRIDEAGEQAAFQSALRTSFDESYTIEVSDACEWQDDDCFLSFGGAYRGTCSSFDALQSLDLPQDGTLVAVVRGQWRSKTKATERVGPFALRVECTPLAGRKAYTCAPQNLMYENFLNDGSNTRVRSCAGVQDDSATVKPFENPFILDAYLQSHADRIARQVEAAAHKTLTD